jgi:hypothetical protein
MKKIALWFLVIAGTILFQSCRAIEPESPLESPGPLIKKEIPVSTLSIPIAISLKPYYSLADKQVPTEFTGGEHPCEGVSFDYFFQRKPFDINANSDKVKIDVSGKYWIKMSYCFDCTDMFSETPICSVPRIPFSCGVDEPMRKMSLQYETSFDILNNYSLKTHTTLTNLKALDACEVTVFNYDATEELLKEVKKALKDVAGDIDKELGGISFKKEAQKAWEMMNDPIKVKDFGILHVNPQSISLSKPKISNDSLYTTLCLQASPVFDHKNSIGEKKLPELKTTSKPASDSFDLNIGLYLNYDSISKTIQHYAGGKELKIKNKTIIFDSIFVTGAQYDELVIKVKFSGSKRGTLYLKGKPKYDPLTESIEFTNVSYDLATKSLLLKTADWLFDDRIIQEITKASKQNLRPQFDKMIKSVNDAFHYNFNEYNIQGAVQTIHVNDLSTRKEELFMYIQITGKMKVDNFGN